MATVTWAKVKTFESGALASYTDASEATISLRDDTLGISVSLNEGDNQKRMNVTINIADVSGLEATLLDAVKAAIDA